MYSSNLCPLQSVLQNGKMPRLQNLLAQIWFAFTHTHFPPTFQFETQQKYLLPIASFCDKIRARMQRTNYICNTDPSNPALSKAQISNDPTLPKLCTKNHKKFSHPVVLLFYPIVLFLHSFIIKFPAFCVWSHEYDWLDNISKHCSVPPYP